MLVTAIEPRRKGMSALYLDGQEYLVDTETLLSRRVSLGGEMSEEEAETLCAESSFRRAKERALTILTYRDHSREELKRKLLASFDEEAAEAAVQKMCVLGLVNDAEYARKLARELLVRKRLGERRAASEMAAKGLDRDLIAQAVAEIAPDPVEQLATIIAKKYTPLPSDEKGRRRMHNALARMGYGWGEIRSAVARAEENTESWVEPDEQEEI